MSYEIGIEQRGEKGDAGDVAARVAEAMTEPSRTGSSTNSPPGQTVPKRHPALAYKHPGALLYKSLCSYPLVEETPYCASAAAPPP